MSARNAVSITEEMLLRHLDRATREVESFPFRAPSAAPKAADAELGGRRIAVRPLQHFDPPRPAESTFSLAERIQAIAPADELYTDVEHRVLRLIRRGIQVYFAVHSSYDDASGLGRLKADNAAGRLRADAEPELEAKIETGAAVSLFAFNAFVLASLASDSDGSDAVDVAAPDLALKGRSAALRAGLHHLYGAIDAHARDDATLLRAVCAAAREQANRLRATAESLQYAEVFTRYEYRIEDDDIVVAGFELPEERAHSEIQVGDRRPQDVVGNHIAKLEASRIAQRLACFDLERQTNPYIDLGGFVFSFIGDGSPGTGKTTLIQMTVSLLCDYCQVAGLPLRYENFSVDQISDYQGRSGQNAKRFCQSLLDPRVVGFGTIDDVDQVCGNRNDRNASAGQLEVTAVFMQEFGGASTVIRGNTTFGLFSNYPEKVDDALRQRTQARFAVDGPQTREDYTDLFHILLEKHWDTPLGDGYEPRVTQNVGHVIDEVYGEHDQPRSPALKRVFDAIVEQHGAPATWRDFGVYLHAISEHDPRFTGRAIKNISDAVLSRMMDFDLPAEWLQERAPFFDQPYDRRVEMIGELRGEITPEIVMQEINRYADSEARYGEAADARRFEQRVEEILLDERARRRAATKREP
jgi:hypothetical protein